MTGRACRGRSPSRPGGPSRWRRTELFGRVKYEAEDETIDVPDREECEAPQHPGTQEIVKPLELVTVRRRGHRGQR